MISVPTWAAAAVIAIIIGAFIVEIFETRYK